MSIEETENTLHSSLVDAIVRVSFIISFFIHLILASPKQHDKVSTLIPYRISEILYHNRTADPLQYIQLNRKFSNAACRPPFTCTNIS